MKYLFAALGITLLFLIGQVFAVTTQPRSLGVVSASVQNMTAAQVLISTSTSKGELIFCTDCASAGGKGTVCVSTNTATGSFVLSTGTVCK